MEVQLKANNLRFMELLLDSESKSNDIWISWKVVMATASTYTQIIDFRFIMYSLFTAFNFLVATNKTFQVNQTDVSLDLLCSLVSSFVK